MATDAPIRHDPQMGLFEVEIEGHLAYLEYRREPGVLAILHTLVPMPIGGRGVAGRLVEAALHHAHAEGLKVDPRCSYAQDWLDRHPGYADLRL